MSCVVTQGSSNSVDFGRNALHPSLDTMSQIERAASMQEKLENLSFVSGMLPIQVFNYAWLKFGRTAV